jgi:RNA polymerase sigma-70 factor (ECF subfamily)
VNSRRDSFARVFAQHQSWLYAFVVTLVGKISDAEEVFQDVCVVLWSEHESFDLATDFRRWASAVARNRVLGYRTKQQREARRLSDVAVELVAATMLEKADLLEERRLALHGCLGKLVDSDRRLVSLCYSESGDAFRAVAEQLNRSVNTLYKQLQRIRRTLRECVDRTVGSQAQ